MQIVIFVKRQVHFKHVRITVRVRNQVFENDASDAVLLIDAKNAFNTMNRSVALHNIQVLCPTIALYLINTYRNPSRLFIAGRGEIL